MKTFRLSDLFVNLSSMTRNRRSADSRRTGRRTAPRSPAKAKLRLEPLEDRCLLATFLVNTLADTVDVNPAVTSLREAITDANNQAGDDIINFSVTGTINLTTALPDLSSNIQIQGPGAASLTVRRNTGGAYRIFTIGGGPTVVLDGLTISNGFLERYGPMGGGIYNAYGTLTVSNCNLSGNSADQGGGIANNNSALTVSNSTLSGNSAGFEGGGICTFGGIVTVTNSTLSDNNSSNYGGGFYNGVGTVTVDDSTLSRNSAANGGGIFNAGFFGGGIIITLTVNNCTLSGNYAYVYGGGIYNGGGQTVNNSIVANSPSGGDLFGSFTGSNNLFGSVLLGPLQNNGGPTPTHAPYASSPAIDAGNNALVPAGVTTDQRGPGFPRVYNGTVDIGGFEVQPPGFATTISLTSAANPSIYGQPVTLTGTVSSAAGTPTGTVSYLDGTLFLGRASLVEGVAQFSTSSLTGGNHQVTAFYDGDTAFDTTNAALTQTVNKADQDINLESLGDRAYTGAPFIPSVTASSGLPVGFAVLSGPATFSGNSLTITGAGTVVIQAFQPGDGNFNAAEVDHSFTVNQLTRAGMLDPTFGNGGKQTIDFTDLYGDAINLVNAMGVPQYIPYPFQDRATGVAMRPDGSILVVGNVMVRDGDPELPFGIAASLSSDGEVFLKDFNFDGFSTTTAVQADGKTLVVGAWGGGFLVQRFNTDSSLDTSFGNGGSATIHFGSWDEVATGVAVQPDGKIVVVGYSYQHGTNSYDFAVARLEGYDPAVVGTEGDDSISIVPGTQAGTLKVTVNGQVTDNTAPSGLMLVEGLGGNDTFTITAAPAQGLILSGQAGSDSYDVSFGNLAGTVTVADSGTSGTDQFTARGTAGNDYLFKDDTKVTLGNPVQQTILYSGIESLLVHGGAGDDTIIDPGSDTQIFGDAGNDTIVINATSGNGVFVDGGAGSDTYVIGGGSLAGPVTVADSGTSGTDSVQVVGTPGDDVLSQTASGFVLNGTAINVTGLEAASVDGGGGAGDSFTVQGAPPLPTTVQGVSDAVITGTTGNDVIRISTTNTSSEVKARLNGALVGTFRPTTQLTVYGLAGDDDIQVDSAITLATLLDGGDGNDRLTGGSGNDSITDLSGNNQIHAGRGNDTVLVGDGDCQIWTEGGDDSVTAGGGKNEIHAGGGNNVILVGSGNNAIWTTGGVDSITTGDGVNQIHAGGDSDTIMVGNGNNKIWGEGGADFITAGDGNNTISAGSGADTIVVGNGSNTITGGSGNDTISAGNGMNTISGGSGNDVINTGNGNNIVDAGAGDDHVKAGSGNDSIKGGSGDDVILGGAGDDLIVGGDGRDLIIGGRGADRIVGDAGDDLLIAGFTAYDATDSALSAIMAEWTSARSYLDRVKDLNGTGTGARANGNIFLITDGVAATMLDDGAVDVLTGSAGQDWFLFNVDGDGDKSKKDKVTDLSASEFATDIDFISGP